MKLLLHYIMTSRFYRWLLLKVLPYVRFSTKAGTIDGYKYYSSITLLKAGHLILSTDPAKLTSKLIPGRFDHVDICLTDGNLVAGMTNKGFDLRTLFDVAKEVKRYVILEVTTWDPAYVSDVVLPNVHARKQHAYDTAFADDDSASYCTELIADADTEGRLAAPLSTLPFIGSKYHTPDDFYNSPNVKVIFDSEAT